MEAVRQDGARSVEEVLQHTRQLADAIDFAANAGVHHGMMAPGDVILDGERTGVTGFGLAQALIKAGIPAEAGAPYGSPQRLAGAPPARVDDIYSLAAITLELLIGTPRDQGPDTSRELREAQGLPERRRIQRPAAHETRLFTTIPGVDAGKLRACFAAAFSEKPGERPSTASEFVAAFHNAISNRGETDTPAPRAVVVPFVSVEREDLPSAPAEEKAFLEQHGNTHKRRRKRKQRTESNVARPAPIAGDALVTEVPPPRPRPIDEVSFGSPARLASRPVLVAWLVAASLAAGFGGGFVVGRQSRPSIAPINVSHEKSVAEPPPTRAAREGPEATVPTTQTVAHVSNEPASSSKPIAATAASQPAAPAVDSGRLLVRSTPAGASVMLDGQSRGVTPLELRELSFGAHTVRVSYPGHDSRERRVTFTEQRPARSLDFVLRSTSVPADAAAAANAPGSLQVTSRPSGAQVFVDDNLIGTTPLLLPDVAAGSRRVRLELSGYKIFTTSVQIEPSERSQVAARLEP
jgi:serine/threonine protein kinase